VLLVSPRAGEAAKAIAGLLDDGRVAKRVDADVAVVWAGSPLEQSLFPRFDRRGDGGDGGDGDTRRRSGGDGYWTHHLLALPLAAVGVGAPASGVELPPQIRRALSESTQCAVGALLPDCDVGYAILPLLSQVRAASAVAAAAGDGALTHLAARLEQLLRDGGAAAPDVVRLGRLGALGGLPRRIEWIGDMLVLPSDAMTDAVWLRAAAAAEAAATRATAAPTAALAAGAATAVAVAADAATTAAVAASAHASEAAAKSAAAGEDCRNFALAPVWRVICAAFRAQRLARHARIDATVGTRASCMRLLLAAPVPAPGAYRLPGDSPAAPLPPMSWAMTHHHTLLRVRALVELGDGVVAAVNDAGTASVWRVADRTCLSTVEWNVSSPTSLVAERSGAAGNTLLATSERMVRYDLDTGLVHKLEQGAFCARGLTRLRDGRIASGSWKWPYEYMPCSAVVVQSLDAADSSSDVIFRKHTHGVAGVVQLPDAAGTLCSVSHDMTLRCWDLAACAYVREVQLPDAAKERKVHGVAGMVLLRSGEGVVATGGGYLMSWHCDARRRRAAAVAAWACAWAWAGTE